MLLRRGRRTKPPASDVELPAALRRSLAPVSSAGPWPAIGRAGRGLLVGGVGALRRLLHSRPWLQAAASRAPRAAAAAKERSSFNSLLRSEVDYGVVFGLSSVAFSIDCSRVLACLHRYRRRRFHPLARSRRRRYRSLVRRFGSSSTRVSCVQAPKRRKGSPRQWRPTYGFNIQLSPIASQATRARARNDERDANVTVPEKRGA